MRKTVAAATMAGALTIGAGAGATLFAPDLVNAQTDDTTGEARPERGERLAEVLAPLVEDGTIDQGQADAVVAAIEEAAPERLRGPGHRLPILEDVTDVLGLSAEELRAALQDGQSLAEIAEANGVDPQAVVDALVATFGERLDNAVENGRLSEDEAVEKRADAAERAEDIVDGEVELRGPRGHHGPRFGDGPGAGGPAESGDESDETTGS